jgi:cytoskeleton protein RodZ
MLENLSDISIATPPPEINQTMGPGARLRKIREARHVTPEDMVKRLHLSLERLTQIENDDYHLMGASVFAKGYLRAYASQLGVAKEEIGDILKTFDTLHLGESIPHDRLNLIHEKMDVSRVKTTRWMGYFIVIVLLGIAGYLWYSHTTAAAARAEKTAAASTEAPMSILPAGDARTSTIELPAQKTPAHTAEPARPAASDSSTE